jgi:putative DNA primase/helicase
MFAAHAPRLRERGWQSLLPLHSPGKRPIPSAWERHNLVPPNDAEIGAWAAHFPTAGIGLAVGPDRVLGVDLDFLDPGKADTARGIALEVLGPTPMIRVGLPPKAMLLYQHAGHLAASRRLGGVELFTTSGQYVLFSIHPDTLTPYHWPVENPLDVSPADLPCVTPEAVAAFIEAIAPHCHRPALARAMAASTSTGNGRAGELLRTFAASPDRDPAAIAAEAIANAALGDRHYSTVAAIVALSTVGLADAEIRAALGDAYMGHFDANEAAHRAHIFDSAIAWARKRIGLSAADLPPALAELGEIWSSRWR